MKTEPKYKENGREGGKGGGGRGESVKTRCRFYSSTKK